MMSLTKYSGCAWQVAQQDINVEREVYQVSRAGLDTMFTEAKKQLEEETRLRLVSDAPSDLNWAPAVLLT